MEHPAPPSVRLPAAPALIADGKDAIWLSPEGEVERLSGVRAAARAGGEAPMVCHAGATSARLGTAPFPAFDLLELFAFARPARFCVPTPRGLARALGRDAPDGPEAEALSLFHAARHLLSELAEAGDGAALAIGRAMEAGGWAWGTAVVEALQARGPERPTAGTKGDLRIWRRIKEYSEHAPPPPAGHTPVEAEETQARLARLLGSGAEERTLQRDYAGFVADAFQPAEEAGQPHLLLAEAGTGIGKTLGYIAPASLWAEKNQGTVWISTFTRNLQRQLDAELNRLYPDPGEKALRAVVRKGRENYLCLLNFEDAQARLDARAGDAITLGLVARWALASRDGDMVGGDFPGWLGGLMGRLSVLGLTDRRGECIHSACTHYAKCFVERSIRRARRARLVIANHALVMTQAALGRSGDGGPITRYVFDEGHHLFDAADSAFSAHLSGRETAELRRWLLGSEGERGSRARGLEGRIADLVAGDEVAETARTEAFQAARALPGRGWLQRIAGAEPRGTTEAFLAQLSRQVHARDASAQPGFDMGYDLETEAHPPVDGIRQAAHKLGERLAVLEKPLRALAKALAMQLDERADELDTSTRQRLDALIRSLERRAIGPVAAWRSMLAALGGETPPEFIDWFSVERIAGREVDMGMHRNWVDPTLPFARTLLEPAHGAAITSATLRDQGADAPAGWATAEARTGLGHFAGAARSQGFPSPFDYAVQTRILVITDLSRNDMDRRAAAYGELMTAAGGGAIGLFTSIARLRAIHRRLTENQGPALPMLLAQHADPLDAGTLVDIFREEEDACLLGTDAVRDGIDVPGRALRLLVYDRVPWPRPSILHKARRAAWEGGGYDDLLTRLKLKQAYGRLVRRADDKGVFVMLERAFPSRLANAFPEGVPVRRIGLADAIAEIRRFLVEEPG